MIKEKNNKAFADNMLNGINADKEKSVDTDAADKTASIPTSGKKLKTSEVTLNKDITSAIRNMEGIMALKLIDIDLRMRQSNEYLESIDRLTEDSKIQLDEIYQLLDMTGKNALNTDAKKLEPGLANAGDDPLTEYLKDNNFLPVKIMNPEDMGEGGGGGLVGNAVGGALGAAALRGGVNAAGGLGAAALRGIGAGALRLLAGAAAVVATPGMLIGAAVLATAAATGYGIYKLREYLTDPSDPDNSSYNKESYDSTHINPDTQSTPLGGVGDVTKLGSGYTDFQKQIQSNTNSNGSQTIPMNQSETIPMNTDNNIVGSSDALSLSGGNAIGVGESGSASEAVSYFISQGWTPQQAAGIVGNLQQESGKSLQTNAVGDGGQAYGIAQWHPDRQAKFQEAFGKPIQQSTFKEQLEFVQWELNHNESRAAGKLSATRTTEEAAATFDEYYERSQGTQNDGLGGMHVKQRIANALALANATPEEDATKTQSTMGSGDRDRQSPSGMMTPPAMGAAGALTSSLNNSGFQSMAIAGKMTGAVIGDLSQKTSLKTAAPDVAPVADNGSGSTMSGAGSVMQNSKPATAGSSNPLAAIDNMFAKLFDESALFG